MGVVSIDLKASPRADDNSFWTGVCDASNSEAADVNLNCDIAEGVSPIATSWRVIQFFTMRLVDC